MTKIRVLVAEDSLTVRELLVDILESDPEIQVIGSAKNGLEAVDLAVRLKPDLITMDVHMPLLDGFTATKEIMARAPTPIIIVSSSASGQEVELSFNAMRAGALMVVPKPDNPHSPQFAGRQGELVTMVKALSQVKVVRRLAPRTPAAVPSRPRSREPGASIGLVAVAASTGGPAALQRILLDLPGDFAAPILVVQHIAAGFISGLAEWLNANSGLRVKVAEHGEVALEHTVFLAPEDRQMGIGGDGRLTVVDAPPIAGFRPSGTYLFESAAQAYGSGVAAVILTGMGSDGVDGLRSVKSSGGYVLAQDEQTSVVYGMPREAVAAGVVDAVVSLAEVAPRLSQLVGGGNR